MAEEEFDNIATFFGGPEDPSEPDTEVYRHSGERSANGARTDSERSANGARTEREFYISAQEAGKILEGDLRAASTVSLNVGARSETSFVFDVVVPEEIQVDANRLLAESKVNILRPSGFGAAFRQAVSAKTW
jgi:hypothetical protein